MPPLGLLLQSSAFDTPNRSDMCCAVGRSWQAACQERPKDCTLRDEKPDLPFRCSVAHHLT